VTDRQTDQHTAALPVVQLGYEEWKLALRKASVSAVKVQSLCSANRLRLETEQNHITV
jgi:hypothetical protein